LGTPEWLSATKTVKTVLGFGRLFDTGLTPSAAAEQGTPHKAAV